MGNLSSCMRSNKANKLLDRQCPHCKHYFITAEDKRKHVKNCSYIKNEQPHEFTIYTDPYIM